MTYTYVGRLVVGGGSCVACVIREVRMVDGGGKVERDVNRINAGVRSMRGQGGWKETRTERKDRTERRREVVQVPYIKRRRVLQRILILTRAIPIPIPVPVTIPIISTLSFPRVALKLAEPSNPRQPLHGTGGRREGGDKPRASQSSWMVRRGAVRSAPGPSWRRRQM